jgi:uncharacterized protein (TIGR03083 family)
MTLDYLAHLREDSARFAAVLRGAPADGGVPTCPDWCADDLLWHLGEVQWLWGTIVRDRVDDPSGLTHPARPADREGLLAFFDDSATLLQSALTGADPAEHRWTWSRDQTVGFIRRRQTHEALIHRIDAELTADVQRAPVDPELATDGVDEALRVMFGGWPEWAEVSSHDKDASLRIRTSDTAASWRFTLATIGGTAPDGTTYTDEPAIVVADEDDGRSPVQATVEGTAADVDCWLWGRPTIGALHRTGEEDVHERFQEIVAQGVD